MQTINQGGIKFIKTKLIMISKKSKKLLLIGLFILGVSTLSFGQNNTAKSKAYYFSAQDSYATKNYDDALKLLMKSEKFGGGSNAFIQSLRVKCYADSNQWVEAKKALDKCYSYDPNNDILKDISPYILKMDEEIKRVEKVRIQREQAANAAREKKAKEKQKYEDWKKNLVNKSSKELFDEMKKLLIPNMYWTYRNGKKRKIYQSIDYHETPCKFKPELRVDHEYHDEPRTVQGTYIYEYRIHMADVAKAAFRETNYNTYIILFRANGSRDNIKSYRYVTYEDADIYMPDEPRVKNWTKWTSYELRRYESDINGFAFKNYDTAKKFQLLAQALIKICN